MATLADMKKKEKEQKKKNKEKPKKVKILLSKNLDDRKILSEDNSAAVEELLQRILKPAKLEKFKFSWSEMKKIPKDKRRQSRNALMVGLDKEKYEESKKIRDNFIFGTNSVIRSLEKGKIMCGVVSPDFDPIMIVDHITSLAHQKRIPVVLLPQLKSICKRCLGFSVKAFGLKNKDSNLADQLYKEFHDQILSLCDPLDLKQKPCNTSVSQVPVPKSTPSNPPKPKKLVIKDLILKRPNENSRCFVPGRNDSAVVNSGLITLGQSADSKTEDDSGFISFGTDIKRKSLSIQEKKGVQEEDDDDSDSDSWSAEPLPKMKAYKPLFHPLKLKKIKPKS